MGGSRESCGCSACRAQGGRDEEQGDDDDDEEEEEDDDDDEEKGEEGTGGIFRGETFLLHSC